MNRSGRRGSVAISVALMMVALLALAGLAIDGAYMMMVRTRLQAVADAAALACHIDRNTCTTQYPSINVHGFTMVTIAPGGIACPDPAKQANCNSVTATDDYQPFLMGAVAALLGGSSEPFDIRAVAMAGRVEGGVACVLSNTTTYLQGNAGITGNDCSFHFGAFSRSGNASSVSANGSPNGIYLYDGVAASVCPDPFACNVKPTTILASVVTPTVTAQAENTTARRTCTGCVVDQVNVGTPDVPIMRDSLIRCPSERTCTFDPGTYDLPVDCSQSRSTCTLNTGVYTFNANVAGPSSNGVFQSGTGGVQIQLGNDANFTMGGGGRVSLTALSTGTCSESSDASAQTVIHSTGAGRIVLQGNAGTGASYSITGNIFLPGYTMDLQGAETMKINGTLLVGNLRHVGSAVFEFDGANTCLYTVTGRLVLVM